jgi:transcriptional regulator with XRE-family HTH domain
MSVQEHLSVDLTRLEKSREDAHEYIPEAIILNLKDQIKKRRQKLKLKQSDLAQMVNLKQPAISRIENANNSSLSLATLQQIASAMDCFIDLRLKPRQEYLNDLKNT